MSDMSLDGARIVGGGSGKAVRKGGSLSTNKATSCTVPYPRVAGVGRIVMRIATNRRENEPERNVLSNMNYVCLMVDVTLLLLQVKKLCDILVSCVNVRVFRFDVYIVQLLGGPIHHPDGQVYHNANAEVCKNPCVKMIANFREYTIYQGRHRARSSRSWRLTEVVFVCTLILQ
jgi:hypothetical protein